MRIILTFALLAAIALAGCVNADGDSSSPTTDIHASDPNSLPGTRFVAIGDQGTGEEAQFKVADTMHQVCLERGCHFAVALGDNIYEIGVSDEYDEQFETKFERPYAAFDMPFYMVQGNHDNSADPISDQFGINVGIGHWYQTGDYEVDYHYRTDRTSDKWQMPARYYDFQEGQATFFAMDTNLMMYWGAGATLEAEDAPIPGDQEDWFEQAASSSDTPWRIAIGHHPYLSNGQHGNAGDYEASTYGQARPSDAVPRPDPLAGAYVERFYETVVCDEVDFIITGHDHDMQWLEPHSDCPGVEQIVSGAAGKTRGPGLQNNAAHFEQYDTNGFLWVEMTETTFTGVFYDGDGNELFERTVEKAAA